MARSMKQLTAHEQYLAKVLHLETVGKLMPPSPSSCEKIYVRVQRTPAEVRRILAYRRKSPKYAMCKEEYLNLREKMVRNEARVVNALWRVENAMRFRGYLHMRLVVAELSVADKTDDEVAQMMLLDAL